MIVVAALLPMMAWAGNIKSPNGNIELKFSVDNTGRPVYEMTYKGKAVIKPSFLGLELAKDKHASKGMQETDLMLERHAGDRPDGRLHDRQGRDQGVR